MNRCVLLWVCVISRNRWISHQLTLGEIVVTSLSLHPFLSSFISGHPISSISLSWMYGFVCMENCFICCFFSDSFILHRPTSSFADISFLIHSVFQSDVCCLGLVPFSKLAAIMPASTHVGVAAWCALSLPFQGNQGHIFFRAALSKRSSVKWSSCLLGLTGCLPALDIYWTPPCFALCVMHALRVMEIGQESHSWEKHGTRFFSSYSYVHFYACPFI